MNQTVYPDSSFDSLFYDHEGVRDVPCRVRIGDGTIQVAYEDEGQTIHYNGTEMGEGHFELRCPAIHGKASLHLFPKAKVMVGYWKEDRVSGMWRVRLGDPQVQKGS